MKKLLTLLLLSPLAFADDTPEYQRITPNELKIKDNLERTILDYSTSDELGMIQLSNRLGHADPHVTLKVYSHFVIGMEVKIEEYMEKIG